MKIAELFAVKVVFCVDFSYMELKIRDGCAAGTTMNYFLDDRINRAEVLFPGVGCFLIAVWLGAWLLKSNSADNAAKLQAHHK